MKQTDTFILRSKTNNGEFAKQESVIVGDEGKDSALIIRKLVLTKDSDIFEQYGFKKLKSYKGLVLCEQIFSIKLNSLNQIINFFN